MVIHGVTSVSERDPSDRATCMNTLSAGTVRTLLIASASGTNFRSGGWKVTITPL